MESVPTRETEVSKVMSNLSKAVECLAQSVESTEARLTGVTREGLDRPSSEKAVEPLYATKMAQDINKIHDKVLSLREGLDDLLSKVLSLRERLNDLLSRVEL